MSGGQNPAATGLHPEKPRKRTTRFGKRHRRLLRALLKGSITREAADRIAKASNSPHWIMELRQLGLQIACERREKIDADGGKVHPGTYILDPSSRSKAMDLLAEDKE